MVVPLTAFNIELWDLDVCSSHELLEFVFMLLFCFYLTRDTTLLSGMRKVGGEKVEHRRSLSFLIESLWNELSFSEISFPVVYLS